MSETFSCPNCTASLTHDGQDHLTVQCAYCNTTVIVPEELRPSAYRPNYEPLLAHEADLHHIVQLINEGRWGEATALFQQSYGLDKDDAADAVTRLASGLTMATNRIDTGLAPVSQNPPPQQKPQPKPKSAPPAPQSRRGAGCFVFFMLLIAAVGGALYTITASFSSTEIDQMIADITSEDGEIDLNALATLAPSEQIEELIEFGIIEPSVSSPILVETGERGIGLGQLNFPGAVATNPEGEIFIADRDTKRIQKFTPNGVAENSWTITEDHVIFDMEVAADGTLYLLQRDDIFRYDSETGEQLGQVVYSGDRIVSWDGMALSSEGELFAVNGMGDYVVHFNTDGQAIGIIANAEDIPGAEGFDNITIDNAGNLYVIGAADNELGDRQDVVFKFNASGEYISRFGHSSDQPEGFVGIIGAIVVDNQGNIYISDFQGIKVFNNEGTFIDLIEVQGYAGRMTINNNGELVVTTNEHKLYIFDVSGIGQAKQSK